MSLSDCPKCWDTPCGCGFNYLHFRRPDGMREQAQLLIDISDFVETFGSTPYDPRIGLKYEDREAHYEKFKKWRKEHRGR